jgi:hypothetical protein
MEPFEKDEMIKLQANIVRMKQLNSEDSFIIALGAMQIIEAYNMSLDVSFKKRMTKYALFINRNIELALN